MLKRNIAYSLAGQGLSMILSLVATRFVFRELGADVLGVIYFAITATHLFIVFSDIGVSPTITREVAAHRATNLDYVASLISTASTIMWAAYIVSAVVLYLSIPYFAQKWLHIEHTDLEAVTLALQIVSAALLLAIPRALYTSVISGYERIDVVNMMSVTATAVQHAGMIVVLLLGADLLQVSFWYVASSIIGILLFMYPALRLSGSRPLFPGFDPAVVRRNADFASKMFANSIATAINTQLDKWIISRYLPISLLGYYGFSQGLISKGAIFPGAIVNAAFPALSAGVANGNREAWHALYHKLQDFCCYVYIPITAAVAMIGTVIIHLVFSREVAQLMMFPLILLATAQFLLGALYVPSWLSYALNRPDISLRANSWALVVVAPLTILLTYQWGIIGAAASSVLYAVYQSSYFIPRFSVACLDTGAWEWVRTTGMFMLLAVTTYGPAWFIASMVNDGVDIAGLIIAYIIGSLFFSIFGWLIVGDELKTVFRQLAAPMIIRMKGEAG